MSIAPPTVAPAETLFHIPLVCQHMAMRSPEVNLQGIRDPQKIVALVVGIVLVIVGLAGLTGVLDAAITADGTVLGVFGIPFWLGLTTIVAGLLGMWLSTYAGGGTTFNKIAAGLVLPAVLFLAVLDWALAVGGVLPLVLGAITLLLAVVLVVAGVVLLYGHPLALVLPIVAVLAIADWVFALTAKTPGEPVNGPTIGLLVLLAIAIGLVGFEGGRRLT